MHNFTFLQKRIKSLILLAFLTLFLTGVIVPGSQSMAVGTNENSFFKTATESKSLLLSYANSNSLNLKSQNQKIIFLFSDLAQQI